MNTPTNITKGPWEMNWDDNDFYFITGPNMPSPYIAATSNGGGEQIKADAKLIACAPEMAEAIEYALSWFTSDTKRDDIVIRLKEVLLKAGYTE